VGFTCRLSVISLSALGVLAGCDGAGSVATQPQPSSPRDPLIEDFHLPPGFKIQMYEERVIRPRSLALGDDGTVYVGTYFFTKGLTSPVYALVDRNRDYEVDGVVEIRNGFRTPNGVAYHDGTLWITDEDKLWRIDRIEETLESPTVQLIFDGFPSRAETEEATDVGHFWRYLAYGPDDRLYIPVGTRWSFLVGAHTANDLKDDWRFSTILRLNPDGSGVEAFAEGARNSMGMDFHPETGELWFTDNGASWPFEDARFYDIPPDELNRASRPGEHFGFPYLHGRLPDPLIGGDAPAGTVPPQYEFEAHTAPLGMRFYTGSMFPEEYRGAIFVAEHGTEPTTPTTRKSQVSGNRISVIRLGPDGEPIDHEVFARIEFTSNANFRRRPTDLLVMPDGSLLVSDDHAGAVYRITYEP